MPRTAIWTPSSGPVPLNSEGIDGNATAGRRGIGGQVNPRGWLLSDRASAILASSHNLSQGLAGATVPANTCHGKEKSERRSPLWISRTLLRGIVSPDWIEPVSKPCRVLFFTLLLSDYAPPISAVRGCAGGEVAFERQAWSSVRTGFLMGWSGSKACMTRS
jgi:hypothetical protein